jgi:2-dehydro-3-deoxy-D-arabinonate dehydratase
MQLGQVKSEGAVIAAVFEGGLARPIPVHSTLDLIRRAAAQGEPLSRMAAQLASRHAEAMPPLLPIHPPEVWACGCTYEASATFRDAEHGTVQGMYAEVYRGARPEIFFTAAEPELGVVLGRGGRIEAYTLANDVSAWDIERENPLYLPQSKIYDGCCALGPVMVTADELPDPYRLQMTCTVTRDGRELFSGSVSTERLHRRIETLIEFLTRANRVPAGTVMLTGTGIIMPEGAALAAGDVVTIRVPEIGELVNRAAVVGAGD